MQAGGSTSSSVSWVRDLALGQVAHRHLVLPLVAVPQQARHGHVARGGVLGVAGAVLDDGGSEEQRRVVQRMMT